MLPGEGGLALGADPHGSQGSWCPELDPPSPPFPISSLCAEVLALRDIPKNNMSTTGSPEAGSCTILMSLKL